MGCAISLAFTDRHPDKVTALVLCNPLTESTFLGGWLGPLLLWLRERMPAVNRQVYRALGHPKLTNGIGSVATAFQLGPRGRALKVYRSPKSSAPMRPPASWSLCSGCSTTWRITRSSTSLRRSRGSRPSAPSGA